MLTQIKLGPFCQDPVMAMLVKTPTYEFDVVAERFDQDTENFISLLCSSARGE
jgi:hypothetical protein